MNADSGLPCRLPTHDGDHNDGRTRFTRVAAPGQAAFPKVEELVARATARVDNGIGDAGLRYGETNLSTPKRAAWKREQDRLRKARQATPAAAQEMTHA